MNTLETLKNDLTAHLLAVTEEERENGDETNPILHAEGGPNRFATFTLFFNDNDGIRVDEDLDLNIVTIHLFNGDDELELAEGELYQWALEFYRDNY